MKKIVYEEVITIELTDRQMRRLLGIDRPKQHRKLPPKKVVYVPFLKQLEGRR